MSRQHSTNRNHRSYSAKARRHKMIGLNASAGAFLAFGLTPLANAPAANADEFELILDPIINSLASLDPTLATDVSGLATAFDPTLVGDSLAAAGSVSDPLAALGSSADPLAALAPAADPNAVAEAFQTDFWLPLHSALQAWITSPLGMQIDNALNQIFDPLIPAGFCGLICNGAEGTMGDPTGGNGGLWFGDGGAGFNAMNDPGVVGGNGGDVGGWGNGGGLTVPADHGAEAGGIRGSEQCADGNTESRETCVLEHDLYGDREQDANDARADRDVPPQLTLASAAREHVVTDKTERGRDRKRGSADEHHPIGQYPAGILQGIRDPVRGLGDEQEHERSQRERHERRRPACEHGRGHAQRARTRAGSGRRCLHRRAH